MHVHVLPDPIPQAASPEERDARYVEVRRRIAALLDEEDDWIAAMATVVCELHHAFGYFDWTGFYRVAGEGQLIIGPYQGTHGCLRIPYTRGVCGAVARTRQTLRLDDVTAFPEHIACSALTRAEIVVPVLDPEGELIAVLDIDSDAACAFEEVDQRHLEALCNELGRRYRA